MGKWARRAALTLAILLASTHLILGASVLVERHYHRELIVVTGGSMTPTFRIGDAILINTDVKELQKGDIITFRSNQGLTTHRLMSFHTVEGKQFVRTKGDANAAPDPDFTPLDSVVGSVDRSYPKLGFVVNFISSRLGLLATLGPLLLYVLLAELFVVARVWREEDEETEVREPANVS